MRASLFDGSLRKRFALSAGAVALALAALTGGLAYLLAYRDAEQDAQATLAGLADAVRNTTAVGSYAGDQVLLEEVANGLIRHPMVGQVEITASSGVRVSRQRGTEAAGAAIPRVAVVLASPFNARETVGSLLVVAEPDALGRKAREQALRLALPMFAQVLLLTLLLDAVAARLMSLPMARLARQVEGLEPGTAERLTVPPAHQRDEIGHLMRRTNTLLQANATALDRERELRSEITAIEGRLRRLLDSSSAAILLLDAGGHLVQGNPTLQRLCTGHSEGELDAEHFIEEQFFGPELMRAMLRDVLAQRRSFSADLRLRRDGDDGGERWVHILLAPLAGDGREPLVEGVLYDVTQRRREEAQAQHQAMHEPLTGLRNRAGLLAELDLAVPAALASGRPLSLIYLDLDGFKPVNDQRGHAAGDEVLREVARRLLECARRGTDVVARLGGDEFVLLLQAGPDEPWVLELAWRVIDRLAEPIVLSDGREPVQIGASLGLAGLPRDAIDRDGLLNLADQAMYRVKHAGKNGVATPTAVLAPLAGR